MTREDKRAYNYARDRLANDDYPVYSDEYELELAYKAGIEDAKNHHHWISVGDELPEYDQRVLWCWDDNHISIGRVSLDEQHIEVGYITHWMPLPQPPVLSNSENIGKEHLIDTNNMIDHFADASKKVEEGGEG